MNDKLLIVSYTRNKNLKKIRYYKYSTISVISIGECFDTQNIMLTIVVSTPSTDHEVTYWFKKYDGVLEYLRKGLDDLLVLDAVELDIGELVQIESEKI